MKFRRDESVAIQSALSELLKNYREKGEIASSAYLQVDKECERIIMAADVLLASGAENPLLLKEIHPWLLQFKLVGQYGKAVLNMIHLLSQQEAFGQSYDHARALQVLMCRVDASYNQSAVRPGVKTGSKHLMPAFDALFEIATTRYNEQYGAKLSTQVYSPNKENEK